VTPVASTSSVPPDYVSGGVLAVDVADWLALVPTADDMVLLEDVCAAVNQWVARTPYVRSGSVQLDPDLPAVVWPADSTQGARMLAARMYRRRNSPSGTQATSDLVVYVPQRDADVDQLLRTGGYARIQVG
jgi:hypothetical protein